MWDAHKDMSLAMLGALLGLALTGRRASVPGP